MNRLPDAMAARRQTTAPRTGTRLRSRSTAGFVLIEVLIALLIFTLGTLGLVGLQATMARANTGAKFRADAATLANDLVGTIWADASHMSSYATAACPNYARCAAWEGRLNARLPGATYEVTPNAGSGLINVSIRWTVPEEGSHAFNTSTAINANSTL